MAAELAAESNGSSVLAAASPGGTRTVAWFHCFAGIAGDMALGSLIDAGADLSEVLTMLRRLPFGGWALDVEPVLRSGVAATRAMVTVTDTVVVRTHAHIVDLIEGAHLPDRVAARALATFAALAQVEARLHRRPVDQVHFHEVGGHDTIVDIVGTVAALEILGVDDIEASAVATGAGMVRTAHGLLPNPAPAVVALLEGAPTWGRDISVELTTPTGAALLAALASGFGPLPSMRIATSGFGAGSRELEELPNCTQVVIGTRVDRTSGANTEVRRRSGREADGGHPDADAGQPVALLEANLDDATGEQLAHAIVCLLDAGALDAWLTPVIMKKGRPGSVVHVLCDPSAASRMRAVLRAETGTLGVRASAIERWPLSRSFVTVDVEGESVRVKVSPGRIKAEHDDVARVARSTGLPLREVAFRAETTWRQREASADPDTPA